MMLLNAAAYAHHSVVGVYDTTRSITIQGVVSRFAFVNPHPYLDVAVSDASTGAQTWRLELDNRYELVAIGVSPETFKTGDRVVVTGSPGRDGSHVIYVLRLERHADALLYEQVGSSPRISSPHASE